MKQPDGLISVLLNRNAPLADRDDAAMDLSAYKGTAVEDALLRVASDPTEDAGILDSCGESLGELWSEGAAVPVRKLAQLQPIARDIALSYLRDLRPDWRQELEQ